MSRHDDCGLPSDLPKSLHNLARLMSASKILDEAKQALAEDKDDDQVMTALPLPRPFSPLLSESGEFEDCLLWVWDCWDREDWASIHLKYEAPRAQWMQFRESVDVLYSDLEDAIACVGLDKQKGKSRA